MSSTSEVRSMLYLEYRLSYLNSDDTKKLIEKSNF
ncbi:hypothetical protein HYG79_10270 [Costertonia aggregata]|uniref:Uncharacterized protein n=1 Tax=Costertonia aggregata TaxID=343403 RepID=A0A7H9AR46_9FLAO|nr:hypothetical protein HYG79_10270 [Costertonia aggregata]